MDASALARSSRVLLRHALHLCAIPEEVDELAVRDALSAIGCDVVRNDSMGRALPVGDFPVRACASRRSRPATSSATA